MQFIHFFTYTYSCLILLYSHSKQIRKKNIHLIAYRLLCHHYMKNKNKLFQLDLFNKPDWSKLFIKIRKQKKGSNAVPHASSSFGIKLRVDFGNSH